MPVILSPSVRVFEDRTKLSDDAAILLIDNVFRRGTVTASSEVTDANGFLENAIDGLTFDWWQPASLPADLSVSLDVISPVDCGLIAVHNGITFSFQYFDGEYWIDLHDPIETESTAVFMPVFPEVEALNFRIHVTGALDEDARIGVVMLGKSIRMPRPFYGGHAPVTFNRRTDIKTQVTEGGFEKGVTSLRTGAASSVTVRHCPASWVRENLQQINDDLRILPFGFAWRPGSEPNQVAYCWLNNEIRATNNGIRDFMDVTFDFDAYIGGFAVIVTPPVPILLAATIKGSPYLVAISASAAGAEIIAEAEGYPVPDSTVRTLETSLNGYIVTANGNQSGGSRGSVYEWDGENLNSVANFGADATGHVMTAATIDKPDAEYIIAGTTNISNALRVYKKTVDSEGDVNYELQYTINERSWTPKLSPDKTKIGGIEFTTARMRNYADGTIGSALARFVESDQPGTSVTWHPTFSVFATAVPGGFGGLPVRAFVYNGSSDLVRITITLQNDSGNEAVSLGSNVLRYSKSGNYLACATTNTSSGFSFVNVWKVNSASSYTRIVSQNPAFYNPAGVSGNGRSIVWLENDDMIVGLVTGELVYLEYQGDDEWSVKWRVKATEESIIGLDLLYSSSDYELVQSV
jgi:hypothetical protein